MFGVSESERRKGRRKMFDTPVASSGEISVPSFETIAPGRAVPNIPVSSEARRNSWASIVKVFGHFIPTTMLALLAVETLLVGASVWLGAAIRFLEPEIFTGHADLQGATVAVTMVTLGSMGALGLYGADQPSRYGDLFARMFAAFLIAAGAMSIVFYVVPSVQLGRGVFAISWLIALSLMTCVRAMFIQYWSRLDSFSRRILVLGAGSWATKLDQLKKSPRDGNFQIVGFLQMGGEREVHASRVLPAEPLPAAVGRYRIDEVVVAVRDRREGKLPVEELLACKLSGVRVTDLSDFYERERGRLPVESMSASWMAFGDGFNHQWPHEAIKVAFDLVISACLLVAALPVMILTAILIRLEDGGPVFYRQERVGRGARPFTMLKFRSMGQDAERDGKARWATVGDARVTRVGRVIRKIRIDELPQLINVLRGEMSFVGPRPERPCFVAELVKQIPYYNVRHCVKPGITGWAQVRHPYSDSISGTTDKLQYDLYYVKNHSVFLDLLIVIETVGVVLWGKGAR